MIGNMREAPTNKVSTKSHIGVVCLYVTFVTSALMVYHLIAEGEFSSVLTLSAIFQCLAFSLLAAQTLSTGDVNCISTKSLSLDALALACRLSSTTWLQGYLPADQTGDLLYQVFDGLSLAMVLWLLRHVWILQGKSLNADDDTFPAMPLAMGSFILGVLLHADLNDRPLFDTLWMCGLFISAVAVLPQLWMMTHGRRSIPALTSHFVAVMAFSRALSGVYMWHAHTEITCEPWIGQFNHAGYAILAAHIVHLMLLGDFAYFYGKNLAKGGLSAPLELPETWVV